MDEFINATPTAELTPLSAGVQDDESEGEMVSSSFLSRVLNLYSVLNALLSAISF